MKNNTRYTTAIALLLAAACGDTSGPRYTKVPSSAPSEAYVPAEAPGAGSAGARSVAAEQVVWASVASPVPYLTDSSGRALYLFANDVPGSKTSACTAACLDKWPVFDAPELSVGTNLTMSDFGRFARADGAWQTTFKGRPLYRFATDAANSVSGDGAMGRWYVARDYNTFVAAKADVTPQGASVPAPYMTNRAGRTVYVFMNDVAASAGNPPSSACTDQCLAAWPAWAPASATPAPMILPSTMNAADFSVFERTAGDSATRQLTYRGYPLYFHTPDAEPGATTGHMTGAWRAIDPATFAKTN